MTTVAKRAPAKKTAKTQSAANVTEAKKASAADAKNFKPKVRTWTEDSKIVALVEENPVREGSGRHERVARLLKHSGKTVAEFLKAGGLEKTIAFSLRKKWIKMA